MSGPSERIGPPPEASASSTISTARSTPKQKPYSWAKRTSIIVLCELVSLDNGFRCARARVAMTALLPLFAQLVSASHPLVDPLNLFLNGIPHAAPESLFEI